MPLSQKQMEYLALAWQCFETEPKIDYNKFYQIADLASANSARELMRVTKKKLKEEYGALAATTSGDAPGTPRSSTNTPKKAGKASGRNGGMSGSATGTPPAAGKKRGRKPKGYEGRGGEDVDDEEEEEEEEEGGSPLKKGKMEGLVEVKREKNPVEEEDDEQSILQ
ncbi:hypothetical protein KC340_g16687 [Hortaea werneckii]|nr:hypothetical protein KC342_g17956 [Hortaea werneckii]KAI7068697.1 hypothetical protein KC339_g14998 [Hortaea werneckii]KAI7224154.1 hypothetical protein KC365_g10922 [Hortaea werneckii]KAI7292627.1 hypothetical protein KC340_g16687 [Hortaea werneckii]